MNRYTRVGYLLFSLFLLFQRPTHALHATRFFPQQPETLQLLYEVPTDVMVPVKKDASRTLLERQFSAKGIIVIDLQSGSVLFEKNPDEKLYPASITKLMTALVALDVYTLDDVITVKDESDAIGNTVHLQFGEQMTIDNMLKGLLIASGNDAAYALASSYTGGYGAFLEKMNEKARSFHMNNTTYLNVSGVEQEYHMTTARDIATLAKEAMRNETIRRLVRTKTATISDTANRITHPLESTNKLLWTVDGMEGIKTGWTTQAGECLVTQTSRDGHTVLVVVLGSADRFGESQKLIEWAFSSHEWMTVRQDE